MFNLLVSGQIKEVRKLNVTKKEKFAAVAILRNWANDERGGYEVFYLVYLPQYLVAFAEIKRAKGYAVVVQADSLATIPADVKGFEKYEMRYCISATQLHAI